MIKVVMHAFLVLLSGTIPISFARAANQIFTTPNIAYQITELEKAITQMLLFIESEYNTRVVLFNWEGSDVGGPTGFPQDEARCIFQGESPYRERGQ